MIKILPNAHKLTNDLSECERLTNEGSYEDAFKLLADIWSDPLGRPQVDGLPIELQARCLLNCGYLAGFLAHARNCSSGQAHSKRILQEAWILLQELFARGSNHDWRESVVRCLNGMAWAEYRIADYDSAITLLDEAEAYDLAEFHSTKWNTVTIRMMCLWRLKRYQLLIDFSECFTTSIHAYGSDLNLGSFYTNRSLAFLELGRFSQALEDSFIAKHYFRRLGHVIFRAAVNNNIAGLYQKLGRFELAHYSAIVSRDDYEREGNRAEEANTYDTQARIYIEQQQFMEAYKCAFKGCLMLKDSADHAWSFLNIWITMIEALKYAEQHNGGQDYLSSSWNMLTFAADVLDQDQTASLIMEWTKRINVNTREFAPAVKRTVDFVGIPVFQDRIEFLLCDDDYFVLSEAIPEKGRLCVIKYLEEFYQFGFYDHDPLSNIVILRNRYENFICPKEAINKTYSVIGFCPKENNYDFVEL